MDGSSFFDAALLASIVRALIPVLLAALGGLISERAGIFNIALEGLMLVGAFAAVAVSYATGSALLGALAGAAAGGATACILAYGAVNRKGDPVIIGIALNLLASGVTTFLLFALFHVRGSIQSDRIAGLPTVPVPGLAALPMLGTALFSLTVIGYIAILAVPAISVVLYRTSVGLRLRGVGERPLAAATLGVSPARYQWCAVVLSGLLCGLGGAQLALGNVVLFSENMTSGRGWIAVVAIMLARATPWKTLLACLLFAATEAVGFRLQGNGLPVQITYAAPYVVTLIALVVGGQRMAGPRSRRRARRSSGRPSPADPTGSVLPTGEKSAPSRQEGIHE